MSPYRVPCPLPPEPRPPWDWRRAARYAWWFGQPALFLWFMLAHGSGWTLLVGAVAGVAYGVVREELAR